LMQRQRNAQAADTGAGNENAAMGAMVSVGTESDDHHAINQNIQSVLRDIRPYGGTPTAALLDDFRYYLGNHPDATSNDPFSGCRDRYAATRT